MSSFDVELSRRVQCFHCGNFFMACQCKGKGTYEDYQLMLNDVDLPSASATIEDNVKFWGHLLKHGQRTKNFNFDLFYQEQLLNRQAFSLLRDPALKGHFLNVWQTFTTTTHFESMKSSFTQVSEENLKKIGEQTWESFFSGRWWELCRISIIFVMNSLGVCGPDPFAPESASMRVLADGIQMVEVALKLGSPNEYMYSIVAPLSLTSMKDQVVYQRV